MPQEHAPDELDFTKINKAPDTGIKTKLDQEIDACRGSMSKAYEQMMDARIAKKSQEEAMFKKIYTDEGRRYQDLLDKRKKEQAGEKEAEAIGDRMERDRR